jgi:hypothetical protein
VQENTFDLEGKKLVVDLRTPFNALHLFWHLSFCLGYDQHVWNSKSGSLFLLVLEGHADVQESYIVVPDE